ncbi:MAG: nucleotide exchange factor GrpE [bacterium]|nr:nucleotide exchange factor GrpE [bacterium]
MLSTVFKIKSIMTEDINIDQEHSSGTPQNLQNDLEERLMQCEKDRDDYRAGWQRAKADIINYKKDEMRRMEELAKYATEDLVEELIGVLDNFDLGIAAMERMGTVEKGVYIIRSQMEDILKKRGLTRILVKVGDEFDPSYAEAIAEEESDKPPGTILQEIEPGYKLHDKIVRPARVKVSRNKL